MLQQGAAPPGAPALSPGVFRFSEHPEPRPSQSETPGRSRALGAASEAPLEREGSAREWLQGLNGRQTPPPSADFPDEELEALFRFPLPVAQLIQNRSPMGSISLGRPFTVGYRSASSTRVAAMIMSTEVRRLIPPTSRWRRTIERFQLGGTEDTFFRKKQRKAIELMRENARGIMEQADEIRTARAMDSDVDLFVDETQTLSRLFQSVEQLDLGIGTIRDSLGYLAGDDAVRAPHRPERGSRDPERESRDPERESKGSHGGSRPLSPSPPPRPRPRPHRVAAPAG